MDKRELLTLSNDALARQDIAETNLQFAIGLPDAETLDIPFFQRRLDEWTRNISEATYRVRRRFKDDPQRYQNSYDVFRIVMLGTCLQRTLGVTYDYELATLPTDHPNTWKPFNSSRHLFIHGPLLGYGGTCVSLPVLYVALGRRLGYPLCLALSNGHMYARWETGRDDDSFNIETTALGLSIHPSSHYLTWPFPLTPEQMATNCFLRSLTPREELACFVCERGRCFAENHDYESAIVDLLQAESIWPQNGLFRTIRRYCEKRIALRKRAMTQPCFSITT